MTNETHGPNAASRTQVRHAGRKARDRDAAFRGALREILQSAAGRLVVGDLLEWAGLFQSVFSPEIATMARNEGRRNFGLQILSEVLAADEGLYDQVERERRARRRAEDRETAAVQQAARGGETDG